MEDFKKKVKRKRNYFMKRYKRTKDEVDDAIFDTVHNRITYDNWVVYLILTTCKDTQQTVKLIEEEEGKTLLPDTIRRQIPRIIEDLDFELRKEMKERYGDPQGYLRCADIDD